MLFYVVFTVLFLSGKVYASFYHGVYCTFRVKLQCIIFLCMIIFLCVCGFKFHVNYFGYLPLNIKQILYIQVRPLVSDQYKICHILLYIFPVAY